MNHNALPANGDDTGWWHRVGITKAQQEDFAARIHCSTQPLDQATIEAIAKMLSEEGYGEAPKLVLGMRQQQPEPEPTPSAGAKRATEAYVSGVDIYAPVGVLAAIIDRETGLPQLVAALRRLLAYTVSRCGGVDAPPGPGHTAETCSICNAKAALAQHDTGVNEP
jgi:hypothetical protein